MTEWGDIEDEYEGLNTHYYVSKPALVLMKYIRDAYQIWDYSEES